MHVLAATSESTTSWAIGYTIGIVVVLVVVALVVPILLLARSIGNEAPKINDALTGSKFIRAVDENSPTAIGQNRPADLATPVQFNTGGVDGVPTSGDFAGNQATHTGFYAFDPFEVQLVTCERTDPAIAAAGIAYCEARALDLRLQTGLETVPQDLVERGLPPLIDRILRGGRVWGWVTPEPS